MSSRAWLVAAVLLGLLGALDWARQRPVLHGPGVLVPETPTQVRPRDARPFAFGQFTLTPLADFRVEARVLSRADYSLDAESALSPMDLALGWGRMSDSGVLARLRIGQSGRFYSYRWEGDPPIPPREIIRSSANMHLIPADSVVGRQLDRVRAGAIVELRGQLVAAERADGWRWVSSLTREDTGAGACELLLVREVATRPLAQ